MGHLIEGYARHEVLEDRRFVPLSSKVEEETRTILKDIEEIYKRLKASNSFKEEISNYAATNLAEFIAECWTEYRNNPHPRIVAKKVGKKLQKILDTLKGRELEE